MSFFGNLFGTNPNTGMNAMHGQDATGGLAQYRNQMRGLDMNSLNQGEMSALQGGYENIGGTQNLLHNNGNFGSGLSQNLTPGKGMFGNITGADMLRSTPSLIGAGIGLAAAPGQFHAQQLSNDLAKRAVTRADQGLAETDSYNKWLAEKNAAGQRQA